MEEGTEAHMETDVSSTTEDVSEAQEVTGSNGNVEMIVIVEKVSEEEEQSSQQGDSQLPVATSQGDTIAKLSPHTTPTKLQNISNSPVKVTESQKTPVKPQLAETPNINTQLIEADEVSLSPDQSEAVVDSSSKTEIQETLDITPVTSNSSPTKYNDVDINLKTSQNTSPVKLPVSSSPVKELQRITKPSPVKETPSQETVKSTPSQEELPENPILNGKIEDTEKSQDDQSEKSVSSQMEVDKEATNESFSETPSESSEKEHKGISRELKSLIKSAKESKIISECTQLTSKTRKSRAPLDTSNASLNISVEADKIQDKRRSSDNSQKSNCSEKSDKVPIKRSMRSQNPEFVNKVKQFLNSVTCKVQKESDEGTDEEIEETKSKECKVNPVSSSPKKKKVAEDIVQEKTSKLRADPYCWRCHWAVEQAPNEKSHPPMSCTVCPRVYHYKCLNGGERNKINTEKSWVCPECMGVLHAESSETRSPAMKKISLAKLQELLKHAMERMVDLNGIEPFLQPVDRTQFPDYDKYIVHPMDLSLMKENISTGHYGSTEAFVADAQWILHNSIIFNTLQSKLTAAARQLVRSCRTEMGEIEACPECYAAAHARRPTWFTDVCTTPHILLWAKLKGFPYWPAKGMSVNSSGLVDVRFFGAHDRAWVPAKDCFLFSEKDPNNFRTKRQDILDSMQEAEQHIRNISRKYGKFVYPPFKTQFDPTKLTEQLKMMIPSFEGEIRSLLKDKPLTASPSVKDKNRSNSKSSKGSHNGDTSESEEPSADAAVVSRKMADGAEIAREEEQTSEDKETNKKVDKTMEVDSPIPPPKEVVSRKRRRSEMEEAVITIIGNSKEKKKKAESEEVKADKANPASSQDETSKDNTTAVKENDDKSQSKDNEPSSSTNEKDKQIITIDKQTLAPIKLVISTKPNKPFTVTKPTTKTGKVTPIKFKQLKLVKTLSEDKDKSKGDKAKPKDDKKSQKRRNSKTNKSLNNSNPANTSKVEKDSEKKGENNSSTAKDKMKETESAKENKEEAKFTTNKVPSKVTDSPKSAKERIQFDDDTSLAVIARESKTTNNVPGMPTISCVRSLSTTAQKTATTATKTTANTKSIEITIDTNSDMRPRINNDQSLVGRVGVRAFARMTSPEPQTKKPNESINKNVQIEIKAEPMDLDDADRHTEKMDLMTAFRLQPVNTASSLREVRINKVVVPSATAKKAGGNTGGAKPIEVRPRARKTFPQPKKADDGRSELNSKNSMVYIPIQPPLTPGPVRAARASNGPNHTNVSRPTALTSTNNNVVNTVTSPLVQSLPLPPASVLSNTSLPSTTTSLSQLPSVGPLPTIGPLSSVGSLSTNVHTVPLITSVNGQWTFSLQPIMSVGGVDVLIQDDPPPLVNGLPDRANAPASIVPIPTPVATPSNSLLVPSSGPMLAPIMPTLPKILPNPGPVLAPTTTTAALPSSATTPAVAPNRTPDNVAPGEPPRLQQRPPLVNPLDAPVGVLPTPSTAGPITAKLNQNAVKLADFFRNLLEDSLEKVDEPIAEVALLKLQLEQTRWRHKQELEELKHNHELTIAEMRSSFEKEKVRERISAQADLELAVKAAKTKQWCANCSQEAQFYCCWNTSYCDYPCQRAHWSQHFAVCTQQRNQDGESSADAMSTPPESRLQPQPDNIPKNTSAPSATPALTVGGKVATRPTLEQSKTGSIIINLEKDASGNSKLKCVGTYKPSTSQAQLSSSIVLNKQVMNNDDSSKKVVTSGGYLIVGASNSTNTVVTPPRRTHTIQYYT